MSNAPALQLSSPPDLLRRFVALPHKLCIRTKDLHLHLTTNERQLAAALGEVVERCAGDTVQMKLTILCDPDLPPELNDAIVTNIGDSIFLSFGRACLIAVQPPNREATGFVAAELLDGGWSDAVVPALMAVVAEIQ